MLTGTGAVPVPGMELEFPGIEYGGRSVGIEDDEDVTLNGYRGAVEDVIVGVDVSEVAFMLETGAVPVPGMELELPETEYGGAVGIREDEDVTLNGYLGVVDDVMVDSIVEEVAFVTLAGMEVIMEEIGVLLVPVPGSIVVLSLEVGYGADEVVLGT